MMRPTGSWVAITTPYNKDGSVDLAGFKTYIDHHIKHGTNELFVTGSAGEVALLSMAERKSIIKEVVKIAKGKIPVFFNASCASTDETVKLAQFIEGEGGRWRNLYDPTLFAAPTNGSV